ncbi:aldehyde dehydrogenase family protein [Vagococcus fluvialis]|uniref:aldehyde dehydrogenase family protein n=1 Tax=Vagococcus fluvialis TaxID=2738 RepID=UPI001D0AF90B|nr:aldehyde dehydrogenase family protein [Vagococcus fluvialis]UDM71565.1 aldehyde dehydrogenase EutE [Vagococcus fluvialis]UDM76426.1 aldehyde dehydrogenase EutE [Vagococcus fluvialis]UDM83256.1 aldehyde dehydrogenase EutE [Vagococcus fluvialis]
MSKVITEENLDLIVRNIINEYTKDSKEPVQKLKEIDTSLHLETTGLKNQFTDGENGVFTDMTKAIEAAKTAQKKIRQIGIKTREAIITEMRTVILDNKESLAKDMLEETGLGNYNDKLQKIELVTTGTPGTEDLKIEAYSGDSGLTTVEYSPYGVAGAVTPTTNPVETIVNNSIGMLAAGNSVVFNVHPSSVEVCKKTVSLLNQAALSKGGLANIITMVDKPSMESLDTLMEHPDVRLLVGTGGTGLVKKLLQSGKKVIGAGAGNPPVLVDSTADIEIAAKEIIKGASFDNNILCIAEKEVFVVEEIADELIFQMINNGAVLLNNNQVEKLMNLVLVEDETNAAKSCSNVNKTEYHINKNWIGKDVSLFLEKLDIQQGDRDSQKLIIFESSFNHPLVQLEQMMPVLPIVRVKDINEGIDLAVKAEKGNRHTAIMHSQNINNLTRFAKEVESTIFVKNASSLAGVGFEGEGYSTMSIAGPTGEGLTSAKNFARKRRCVLGQGGLSI